MDRLDFRALWDRALTYAEFVRQSREQCALWTGVYRVARIPAWTVERACQPGRQGPLLVVAEDWCGDASHTVPYLAKLGDPARCLAMRVLRRDYRPDLM